MARLGVMVAVLLAWAPAAGAAPGPAARTRLVRDAPAARGVAPAEGARAWLRAHPQDAGGVAAEALELERVVPLAGGATVRFAQRAGGLPVLGASVVVRLDGDGRVRWTHSTAAPLGPLPPGPAVPAAAAAAIAAAAAGTGAIAPAAAQLAVEVRAGEAALVWVVPAPGDPWRLRAPVVRVDAATGAVLRIEDRIWRFGQASVWPDNPVKTPARAVMNLPLPAGATGLEDPDFTVKNAVDHGACSPFPNASGTITYVHFVGLDRTALADPTTSYLAYAPAADSAPADAFAEVELYYQVSRGLAWFRDLVGDPGFALAARPLLGVTNFLLPRQEAASECPSADSFNSNPLVPFDNAALVPANAIFGGFPPSDALVFGQGTAVDFAYDGDVVLHELTHAVQVTVADVSGWVEDAAGLDASPGALAEGFADYFSSAIEGDPEVGEYAGRVAQDTSASGALRSLLSPDACPTDIAGEAHLDSIMWSGALWSERGRHDPVEFDRAAFAVLSALRSTSRLTEARALLLAELEARFGATDAAAAATRLGSRFGPDCERRIVPLAPGAVRPLVVLTGTDVAPGGSDGVPGPVQLRVPLAAAAGSLRLAFADSFPANGSGSPGLRVVANAGAPITWTWSTGGATPSAGQRASIPVRSAGGSGAVVIPGPFPAGDVYLQLADAGASWVLVDLSVSPVVAPPPRKAAGGGCGAPGSPTAAALLGLALALRRWRPRGRAR